MVIKTCIFTEFLVLSCNTENWNNTCTFFCRIIYVDLTMSKSNVLVSDSRKKRMRDIFFQYVQNPKKKNGSNSYQILSILPFFFCSSAYYCCDFLTIYNIHNTSNITVQTEYGQTGVVYTA